VNPVPDIFRILPEVILTLTGVAVMLIDASLPPGFPRRFLGWVAAIGTTIALWASLWQLSLPQGTGFHGTVETSAFTIFFHVLICGIVLVALLLSLDTLPEDSHHQGEYYALITFGAMGMCLLTGAVELLVVFIALEISSIATYILAGYRKQTARGPEAAIKYFLLGSFATAFLLYGVALIFGATGTTQIYEIARAVPLAVNQPLLIAGMALMLVGILFKVSAAPFHVWTPDVYEGSPSPVTGFMAAVAKAGAFAALLRVFISSFGTLRADWQPIVWGLAFLSLLVGAIVALSQRDVKRMMAYSSINHAGFILLGVQAATVRGVSAALYYLFAYMFLVIGSFAVIGVVARNGDIGNQLSDYRGLARRQPLLALAFAILLLGQAGAPFTTGFLAKFQVVAASVDAHSYVLAVVAMVTAAIATFFYLRLAITMYSPVGAVGDEVEGSDGPDRSVTAPETASAPVASDGPSRLPEPASLAVLTQEAPTEAVEERRVYVPGLTWAALTLCVGFTVVFGIYPAPIINFAHQATLLFI